MTRSLSRAFSANSRSISPSRSSVMSVEPAVPFVSVGGRARCSG